MLAHSRHYTHARRGIVLVLILAMLGLLALIGVTFATFSGQAKINARNFAQSVISMQDDELMDFALSQLITDTGDVRSAIRGHSLARDMYGNDGLNNLSNGYLTARPDGASAAPFNDAFFYVTVSQAVPNSGNPQLWDFQTNIPVPNAAPAYDPAFYGYDFTHWILRVSYTGPYAAGSGQAVTQSFEIIVDNYGQPNAPTTAYSGQGYHSFRVSPIDHPSLSSTDATQPDLNPYPSANTVLSNPTQGITTQMAYIQSQNGQGSLTFILDGRWLHAFNGPGMGPNGVWGNFRYNGGLMTGNGNIATPGRPASIGMDEDYDACDLENWFLAIQSADGQVIIPSFHRPGILRYDPNGAAGTAVNDWKSTTADSMSRVLRPRSIDQHDVATFPDLIPDPITGKITYDVDNDGDGITDSVWLDLGYPARRDSRGQLYKPLFAFLVIGLNGRIPLNTAGNLASNSPTGPDHASHLGNSVSEVDPTYALQNAFAVWAGGQGDYDPFNTGKDGTGNINVTWPPLNTSNTQVDNSNAVIPGPGGIDVRLTQLRNLLAGTRPQNNPFLSPLINDPTGTINGDNNSVYGSWPGGGAKQPYFMPNGLADSADAYPIPPPPAPGSSNHTVCRRAMG